MTAKQFLKKFPKCRTIRENCMMDQACPQCGQRNNLVVQATIWTDISDEGTDHYSDNTDDCGDTEYDSKSEAKCPECGFMAKLRHFTMDGLDDAIQQLQLEEAEKD